MTKFQHPPPVDECEANFYVAFGDTSDQKLAATFRGMKYVPPARKRIYWFGWIVASIYLTSVGLICWGAIALYKLIF